MKTVNFAAGAALAIALGAFAAPAAATVVTFDTLPDGLVPDGYGGITWNSNWAVYSTPQDPYNPESDPARVYTNYALWPVAQYSAVPFYFSSPVVFDGAYFAGGYYEGVSFNLYDGATLVATSGALDQTPTPTFLASGYGGPVTEVDVVGTDGFYVMDNVTYNGTVPEPAAWAMLLTGFFGLGAVARRRRLATL